MRQNYFFKRIVDSANGEKRNASYYSSYTENMSDLYESVKMNENVHVIIVKQEDTETQLQNDVVMIEFDLHNNTTSTTGIPVFIPIRFHTS